MERLQIVKISPTENMTVLVETPVPGARHAEIAEKLMAYGGVNCEQVGYIEPPRDPAARARLQMMGGEFCGNATMSLASFLCFCDAMPAGAQADIPLEVSGMEGTLACHVCCLAEGEYEGTVQMPRPLSISRQTLAFSNTPYSVICVRMDGIAHLLPDGTGNKNYGNHVLVVHVGERLAGLADVLDRGVDRQRAGLVQDVREALVVVDGLPAERVQPHRGRHVLGDGQRGDRHHGLGRAEGDRAGGSGGGIGWQPPFTP